MRKSEDTQAQRIDKWLWYARFFKTRSLASEVCRKRKVRVNGRVVTKASLALRAGDVLTFPQARHIRTVRILAPGDRRGPASEAQALYEDLAPPPAKATAETVVKAAPAARAPGSGRPTKAERRAVDRMKGAWAVVKPY